MAWRVYQVTVAGYGAAMFSATSRGQAIAQAWRSAAFADTTFGEFLRMASVCRVDAPLADGYAYVRDRYGVDPKIGQRLRQREGGREGIVLYPGAAASHIAVAFDDDPWVVRYLHPTDAELLSA